MPIGKFVEYEDAGDEIRAVYDDIMATRGVDWINNFWKALAQDPAALKRTWESIKQVMAPGALDPLTKEMLYVAVSVTNGCDYCINSHLAGARAKGMTDDMLAELMELGVAFDRNGKTEAGMGVDVGDVNGDGLFDIHVTNYANETNALVTGWQVELDDKLRDAARGGKS